MAAAGLVILEGQASIDAELQGQLEQLFPSATSFSSRAGEPPHFKAFADGETVIGFAFWTTDLQPLERGYDGPIKMLVGMDVRGALTNVIVVEHREPYGDLLRRSLQDSRRSSWARTSGMRSGWGAISMRYRPPPSPSRARAEPSGTAHAEVARQLLAPPQQSSQ